MTPLSNGFTAVSICATIVFGYLTMYGSIPLSIGFSLTLMSIILVIASMVSVLPEETEFSIQEDINKSKHLQGKIRN